MIILTTKVKIGDSIILPQVYTFDIKEVVSDRFSLLKVCSFIIVRYKAINCIKWLFGIANLDKKL
ncbi:hypothetical protein Cyrtocomes_00413 [Candidatus Cyrtobacter comes]|uniref:Uncharacterized protein n=1 Tax=Candidatus Cyrtobacter comes TaxID=675776 RepID=A0ABU5L7D8_9RICK|nr:hypothetical protein [Candidatus Cyrtobacter comes]